MTNRDPKPDPIPKRMRAQGATRRHPTDPHLYRLGETVLFLADTETIVEERDTFSSRRAETA